MNGWLLIPGIVVVAAFIAWALQMLLVSAFLAVVTIGASLLTDWIGRQS